MWKGELMVNKLKLGLIIDETMDHLGGAENVMRRFFEYLDQDEFHVSLFYINYHNVFPLSFFKHRYIKSKNDIYFLNLPGFLAQVSNHLPKRPCSTPGDKMSFRKYISVIIKLIFVYTFNRDILFQLQNNDIIYVFSETQLIYIFLPLIFISKSLKSRVIYGTHTYLPVTFRFRNKIENKLLDWTTSRIHYTSNLVYRLSNIKRKGDFVLPLGVDTNIYYPDYKVHDKIRFLFVGRLVKYKGIQELLKAWELFTNHTLLELHIVGGGELEGLVIGASKKIQSIIYHGTVEDKILPNIYRSCDIFVFPTYGIEFGEFFGLVVLEAISSGEYVILSDKLKGVFDDFETKGVLEYVPVDPFSIFSKMKRSAEDILELRSRCIDVREYIVRTYNWKVVIDEFSKIIRGINQPNHESLK